MSTYQPSSNIADVKVAHPRQDSYSGEDAAAIDVSATDAIFYPTPARGLYVGVTGNVNVVTLLGTTVLFTAVPAGAILPITVQKVLNASTTASGIVAIF